MPALTRGPLPARVYWVRRLFVLGTAVLLVVGIARLLGSGSDASSDADDQAAQVAADTSSSASYTPPGADSTTSESPRRPNKNKGRQEPQEPVLAEPEGTCDGSDVAVTPKVDDAAAGRDVTIVLQLRTVESEACTWPISRDSLTVSITSGDDDIWSSRECPRAIPVRDVVVRRAVTTDVELVWKNAKRSDATCSIRTEWALPGWYHVTAAALGGEPSDVQFELETPMAATVTKSVEPTGRPGQGATGRPVTPSNSASNSASNSPSGAVEPNG